MGIIEKIIFVCIAEVLYVFLLYPALLKILSVFFKKEIRISEDYFPSIDLVVAAYNEEKLIEGAIRSIYEDTYPPQLLKVWVVNDGSGDRTAEILASLQKQFPSLHMLNLPRTGKNGALNEVFKKLSGEVTVFMDADSRIISGSLHAIVKPFSDPEVGAVIGELTFDRKDENAGTRGESAYKVFEKFLKVGESAIHSTVSSHGPFYAVHRNFVGLIPNNKVCDDYLPLLRVALEGKRILYVPEAHIFEVREKDLQYEFGRIVRFTAGGLASIWETKRLLILGFKHAWFTFFLWSHKIFRWISPYFLFTLFFATTLSVIKIPFKSPLIWGLFILQVIFYLMVLAGWRAEKSGKPRQFLKLCYFFFVMNVSMMTGVYKFLKNTSTAHWEPSNR